MTRVTGCVLITDRAITAPVRTPQKGGRKSRSARPLGGGSSRPLPSSCRASPRGPQSGTRFTGPAPLLNTDLGQRDEDVHIICPAVSG
ncbi:hypothetical protein SKAU_G00083460 [Synaphobranchus kaupii]|uniref:Uncharacterized protein n=1 Tax=Synaphobranchus kaupii TaxID=118154 RepID=A0A9Q1FV51_SYNKA|nr:hypothetical protein SKAU_G00083460 [Synaphobranchus kaupii]